MEGSPGHQSSYAPHRLDVGRARGAFSRRADDRKTTPLGVRKTIPDGVLGFAFAFLILGGPGLLLVKLARDLQARNTAGVAWVVLLLLPISIVLFAVYGYIMLLRVGSPP